MPRRRRPVFAPFAVAVSAAASLIALAAAPSVALAATTPRPTLSRASHTFEGSGLIRPSSCVCALHGGAAAASPTAPSGPANTPPAFTAAAGPVDVGVAGGLQFRLFDAPGGITAQARDAFAQAALLWSNTLADVGQRINLQIGYSALAPGVIAQAGSTSDFFLYNGIRNALVADANSAIGSLDDKLAAASLQAGDSFNMLLNGTSNSPNGSGSRAPYLDNDGDANNRVVNVNSANIKALGFGFDYAEQDPTNTNQIDGFISFSTLFNFDLDPNDGIASNAIDFVGAAAHEIGHALGFVSGVDILDNNSPQGSTFFRDDQFIFATTLDLFRYTPLSAATAGGVPSFTLGNQGGGQADAYFSLDRGATKIASFSTGRNFGDGEQASHWKDDLSLGMMDPTATNGERVLLRTLDLRAMDVIGYTRFTPSEITSAPEPGSLALLLVGGGVIVARRRRRSRAA